MSNNTSIKPKGEHDNSLYSKAQEYTHRNFCVIPVDSEKKPVLGKGEVECRRGRIATSDELAMYFGNDKGCWNRTTD